MLNAAAQRASQRELDKARKLHEFLVKGVWLYILLLIFEGALRKWVLPSLAAPLLIIRDPVALGLLVYAWYNNVFPHSIYIVLITIIGAISVFTSLFIGHGNLFVTLYGARILFIHFPFIFLMGSILTREDVLKIGRVILWISIPMALLIAMQFYSPQSSWVNRGVGGDMSGAGFGGAMGYFRPPGTFSFTNGTVAFFSLAAAYIFYFWLRPGFVRKSILIGATVGLILALPFSISRSLTFTVVVMLVFVLMTLSQNPKLLSKILMGVAGIGVLVVVLSQIGILDTPMQVFMSRFESAATTEGGVEGTIGDRYFGGMYRAIVTAGERPFFGEGMGMGTNAGAVMLGAGRTFLIAEGEWPRTIGEMGALLGIAVILIRLIITFKLGVASYFKIQEGQILSWMLFSFTVLIFPQGVWAQPTMLGFGVVVTGLLIASFNEPIEPSDDPRSIHKNNAKIKL